MYFRTKKSGPRAYLQIVESHWRDGRPRQSVLVTLGRLEELQGGGQVDGRGFSGAVAACDRRGAIGGAANDLGDAHLA